MSMTMEEQMALAVLKGDRVAALMLADRICETYAEKYQSVEEGLRIIRESGQNHTHMSYDVYHWPEFQAFCRRLGVAYDLPTLDLTITMRFDETVEIAHKYRGQGALLQLEEVP